MPASEKDVAATTARHVFISFASSDDDLAHRAVQSLEGSGIRCWISDRDIEPASSYPAAITSAVTESGAVLLLLTESSNRSRHVLREIELAFTARTPILPVRISGATPSSDLQYFLSTTQWLDAGPAFDEADLARVEPRLRELLQRQDVGGGRLTGGQHGWPRIAAMAAALVLAAVAAFVFWSRGGEDARLTPDGPGAARPAPAAPDTAAADGGTAAPATGTAASGPATPGVRTTTNPRDGQAYIWVPPGRFTMGCSPGDPECEDDEKPAHVVEIGRGFWIARTEVTERQYRKTAPAVDTARAGAMDVPATAVAWADAKAYCEAAGGRLPTEAEWEYAARAGTSTRYYDSLPAIAWFADNSDGRARPVGAKAANAFGLHDMLGNVSEWVRDRYYNEYDDTSDDATVEEPLAGNASGVARGGSWVSEARGVRVSRRLGIPPDAEEPHIGFRCAADRL